MSEATTKGVQTPVDPSSKPGPQPAAEQKGGTQDQPVKRPESEPGNGGSEPVPRGEPTPNEEIRQLRDRMAKMELENESREAERKGQDTLDAFIRDNWAGAPADLLRKLLPATTDKGVLHARSTEVFKAFSQLHEWAKKTGRFNAIPSVSQEGGTPVNQIPPDHGGTPAGQLLASGLRRKQ